jgi:hypothetical protein
MLTPILIFLDLKKPFKIETHDLDYVIDVVLTYNRNPIAYHSETLFHDVRRYPNYDKEIYFIVQACR